jgi:hypothetical protein
MRAVSQFVWTGYVPKESVFVAQIHDTIGLPTEVWRPLKDDNFIVSRGVKSLKNYDVISPLITTTLGLALRNT